MSAVTLTVNGRAQTVDVDPATPLLYILRNDLGLQGPRFGCGLGQCGACSVIINGAAVRSCVTQVSAVKGDITTLEGLAKEGSLHPVQQAWIDEQVPQCGFCQNGQIITAKVLLDRNPNPTDQQIRDGMAGALCRCMTYYRVQAAVKRAAEVMRRAACPRAEAAIVRRRRRRDRRRREHDLPHERTATDFPERLGSAHRGRGAAASAGPFTWLIPDASAQAAPYPDIDFRQLDSWIVIHQDNTATFHVGKTDLGQGTGTAFRQMMADELDMPYERTTCIMGSTDVTPDQGGSGGSDAIQTDGWPMRRVAAEARRVLLEMASTTLAVPVDQLAVSNGVVTVKADPSKRVTYGELVGGKRFNVTLSGNNVDATTGTAKVKPVQDLKIVGQSPQRYDIPAKVDGSLKWAVDMKVPGMVHARNVKPPFAGAKLVSIDESSVSGIPGFIKVVSKGNYVAVVCEREEQAIRAARQLKIEWQKPATAPFPASDDLFTYMRTAKPTSSQKPAVIGDPDAALASAATVVEAEYDMPFQGHTSFAPAHAMADPSNGQMTIYSNDMKSYGMRTGVAEFLGIPREQVRVVWMEGPQAYGRTAADDAGFEAAYLAKEIGRPVRVQWMRNEETAWDTKGPAFVFKIRGGLDANGNLIALDYDARAADFYHVGYNEHDTVLIAQLMGARRRSPRPAAQARRPTCTQSRTAARAGTSCRCRSCTRRRCEQATCAIQTDRKLRLPPSRSSTSSPRRQRPIRSSSACVCSTRARRTTVGSSGRDRSHV